jgi:hypothetical protein
MMQPYVLRAALAGAAFLAAVPCDARGQHAGHVADSASVAHTMWSISAGGGWRLLGMAQAYPVVTIGAPGGDGPLRDTGWYLTQPAVMANLESPASRLVIHATLDFEGITQPDGELTFGGWGEGFIDSRHPHTLIHEAMVSLNVWRMSGGSASISAGKGFAPYGTADPMSRPGLKYPTNHHLSQILERWTLNGTFRRGGWSVEAGVFGGAEPEGPYDLSNIESFGDSWSARLAWRGTTGARADLLEAAASIGSVSEEHESGPETTRLWNVAAWFESAPGPRTVQALVEYSRSDPEHGDGIFSMLGEAKLTAGPHEPYARVEYATRPEYARLGAPGTGDFFRYDHDAEAIGTTRWLIGTLGYGVAATRGMISVRPFLEAQWSRVKLEEGPAVLEPEALFGDDAFWSLSFGMRVYFGGDPMRMGSYGVLDPMTTMNRSMDMTGMGEGSRGGG